MDIPNNIMYGEDFAKVSPHNTWSLKGVRYEGGE